MPDDSSGTKRTFSLGQTVATQGAVAELSPVDILVALTRHSECDWGDLERCDKASNDRALIDDGRLFSAYHSENGVKFYIITEWDRSVTTVLLPHEY